MKKNKYVTICLSFSMEAYARIWYESYIVVAKMINGLAEQQNEFQLSNTEKYEKYYLKAFNFCERSGDTMYEFKTIFMQEYGFAVTSKAVDFFFIHNKNLNETHKKMIIINHLNSLYKMASNKDDDELKTILCEKQDDDESENNDKMFDSRPTTPENEDKLAELLLNAYIDTIASEMKKIERSECEHCRASKTVCSTILPHLVSEEERKFNKYFYHAFFNVMFEHYEGEFEITIYECFSFTAVVEHSYKEELVKEFFRDKNHYFICKPLIIRKRLQGTTNREKDTFFTKYT